jgi:hypothetical protein
MSGGAAIRIAAPPEAVYAAVADLRRMGEWSPENWGGEWLDPGRGPVAGATFEGVNRDAREEWRTLVTVTEADPPNRFTFQVAAPGQPGTTWSYEFRADGDGTLVTETFVWHWTPVPDEGFRGRVGRMPIHEAAAAVAAKERHLQAEVDATLAALRLALRTGGT